MWTDEYLVAVVTLVGAAAVVSAVAWVAMLVIEGLLRRCVANGQVNWKPMRRPLVMTAAALAVYFIAPATTDRLSANSIAILTHAMSIIAIVGVGWLVLTVTDAIGEAVTSEWDISKEDNRRARAMLTKFRVMRRVWAGVVAVCTVGAVLMTFPSIRSLGAGLLASAGVAGIVLGIALRPTLETFLASVQVAITEPISIDDVLIVEGEWGRVEEIRPTYVVLRIWDDRRLIVPLTYFISQPFQNWTRTESHITGVVTLKLDFTAPIDTLRKKAGEIVEASEKYDGRFWNVQITDADDKGMTVRVLCTAADASRAWDLRCEVREKLITFLQQQHAAALPRLRAEVDEPGRDPQDADDAPAPPAGEAGAPYEGSGDQTIGSPDQTAEQSADPPR